MAKGKSKKRSKDRKSGRLTKNEIKRAGGIKQAWAARRGKTKSPRKASHKASSKSKHPKKKHPKKAPAKRAKARQGGKRKGGKRKSGSGRSSSRVSSTSRTVKSTVIKRLPGHTIVVSPVPPSGGHRRGKRKGSSEKRKSPKKGKSRKGQFKKGGGRRARESYAMENPLSGFELAIGLFTGALGFGVSDFVDRYVATHALTDKNAKDAAGNELYADAPPATGGKAGYQGLFNGTAVLAPMNLPRWGVGIALAGVPFVAAAFVKAPAGRSALQMFGFGAAIRTLGKGLGDGVAYLTAKTAVGQRLYDDRQRAMAILAEANGGTAVIPSASLPSSGLGTPPASCKGCGKTGMGACCSSCASKSQQTSVSQGAPPPPPPPPQAALPQPQTQSLTGVPNGIAAPKPAVIAPKKNPYAWGSEAAE